MGGGVQSHKESGAYLICRAYYKSDASEVSQGTFDLYLDFRNFTEEKLNYINTEHKEIPFLSCSSHISFAPKPHVTSGCCGVDSPGPARDRCHEFYGVNACSTWATETLRQLMVASFSCLPFRLERA